MPSPGLFDVKLPAPQNCSKNLSISQQHVNNLISKNDQQASLNHLNFMDPRLPVSSAVLKTKEQTVWSPRPVKSTSPRGGAKGQECLPRRPMLSKYL